MAQKILNSISPKQFLKLTTLIGILYLIINKNLNLLETVGILWSLFFSSYFIPEIIKTIYNTWIGPALGHNVDFQTVGKWALVTGATDGIGLAYCKYLAQQGLNIVLISRTGSKLEKVCAELESEYGIETKYIIADFTKGNEIYLEIGTKLNEFNVEIGTLINNVGICYNTMEYFLDVQGGAEYYEGMINCNVLSAVRMTYLILPEMLHRKKGIVINVGSISYFDGCPFLTVYSSTKAFLSNFTHGLDYEYKEQGIIFQFLCPAYVTTGMSGINKANLHIPNPKEFVEAAVKTVGLQGITAAWIPHRFVHFCLKWSCIFRRNKAFDVIYKTLKDVWLNSKKKEVRKLRREPRDD